ncbi:MAG: hypothetical protein V1679_01110 [Candidatus Peregrinibacteria bacterium]
MEILTEEEAEPGMVYDVMGVISECRRALWECFTAEVVDECANEFKHELEQDFTGNTEQMSEVERKVCEIMAEIVNYFADLRKTELKGGEEDLMAIKIGGKKLDEVLAGVNSEEGRRDLKSLLIEFMDAIRQKDNSQAVGGVYRAFSKWLGEKLTKIYGEEEWDKRTVVEQPLDILLTEIKDRRLDELRRERKVV